MDRAVIYARVSTDEQAQAHSLPSQLDACRTYCKGRGYVIVKEVKEDYTGTQATRPQLSAVMENPALFDVLVVFSIDRFARGLAVQVLLEKELLDAGKRLEYVMGGGENTPEGRLTNQIQAVIAEYEVQQIKRRTTRGHYARAKAGHVVPGRTPAYGYKYVGSDRGGKYEIVPEEAKVVKEIFDWYTVEKIGMTQIARRLTERGLPTKWDTHGLRRGKKRGVWGVSTVQAMLKNPTYVGRWVYGRNNKSQVPVEVGVPTIISEKQFRDAQKQAVSNLTNAKRNTKSEYLLRRRLICGVCGMRFACVGASGQKKPAYRCYGSWTRNSDYKIPKCHQAFIAEKLDALAWQGIERLLLDPQLVSVGWEKLKKREENQDVQQAITTLRERAGELEARRDRLVELYADNQIPRSSLDKQVTQINGELTSTVERLNELDKKAPTPTRDELRDAEALLKTLAVGARAASYDERVRVAELLSVSVLVSPGPRLSLSATIGSVPIVIQVP